jgi:hypothetical protein
LERGKTAAGLLALAAMLLLASPGVDAVRAEGDPAPSSSEAAQCSDVPSFGGDAEIEALLAELRREQLERIAAGQEGPVMLNGRGYNYGPAPRIELDLIRAEGARAGHP